MSLDSAADVLSLSQQHVPHLLTISLGAVFFGAGSYIGNGHNFMVKAIADRSKVHTPGFMGYMIRFSIPMWLPILILVGWIMLGRL